MLSAGPKPKVIIERMTLPLSADRGDAPGPVMPGLSNPEENHPLRGRIWDMKAGSRVVIGRSRGN